MEARHGMGRSASRSRPGAAGARASEIVLAADPRNVAAARQHLRDALESAGLDDLVDRASLAVSEVVTNAFVHTGTPVRVRISTTAASARVEVEDGGSQRPVRRFYADMAGTGRGLLLLDESVDRWDTTDLEHGKVVWFELGDVDPATHAPAHEERSAPGEQVVRVTLRQVPLLMHVAWQEHAASLLREYLLHVLNDDDAILDKHARASAAMSLLHDQLPAPDLSDEADALMADAIEPHVTADEVVLEVPTPSVGHFEVLDELLRSALGAARAGAFLSPPTQPEIGEMRQWLCSEVARQAGGDTTATPWLARTDVRATLADQALLRTNYEHLAAVDEPLLATDEASIIVAASPAALELLGYRRADELLGRRVIVVVPARFHQAHIAGTTLHATNGRDHLLGVPIRVPMVRSDGSELPVQIEVRPERMADDRHVFVARFRPA